MISKGPSATLRTKSNIENVTAAIGQKDKMIELLRRELEGFRTLRQDYDRLNDRKTKMLDKCDSIKREIVTHYMTPVSQQGQPKQESHLRLGSDARHILSSSIIRKGTPDQDLPSQGPQVPSSDSPRLF